MAESQSIAATHPALPGHFPGRPVVPGAVILQCVIDAAAATLRTAEPVRSIGGVRRVKFLRMLQPGEAFSVEFDPPGASGLRFRVQSGAGVIVDGQLAWGKAGEFGGSAG